MPDPTQTATDPAASGTGGLTGVAPGVVIPAETQAQFPDIIGLIQQSESMNDEERQYWVNILPIMTPEQQGNLKDILANEREQLAAIDQKYASEIDKVGQQQMIQQTDEERRRRAAERAQAEQADAAQNGSADDLLKQIQGA